jgi:hypothetical protein
MDFVVMFWISGGVSHEALHRCGALAGAGTGWSLTRVARQQTLDDFSVWLYTRHGVMLQQILTAKQPDPEEIHAGLLHMGRRCIYSGKSLWQICGNHQ